MDPEVQLLVLFEHFLGLGKTQETVIHEKTVEPVADRPGCEDGGNRGVYPSREAADDPFLPHFPPDLLRHGFNPVAEVPIGGAGANPEVGQQSAIESISEIEKMDGINQWKGVAVYTKSMLSTIEQLETRLKGEDLTQENGLEIIELYKNYMSSYDLIEDVSTLVTSLNKDKISEVGQELVDEIEQSISDATGKHDLLEKRLNSKLIDILKTQLNNINYCVFILITKKV